MMVELCEKKTISSLSGNTPLILVNQPKPQHKAVLDYLRGNPFITNEIVQDVLSVKQTRAYIIIREMVNDGLIVKCGAGKGANEYVLAENPM